MPTFQNSNIVFRCPASLKAKMKAFAEANDQHLSSFIRSACVEVLRREMPAVYPRVPSASDVDSRLAEVVR
jgi:hypothetical protein